MFIDRAVIEVRSGKGGNGAISFLHEKNMPKGGPNGGNGGRGGSVYLVARQKVNTLINFRHSITIQANDGEKGDIKLRYGKYAEDVYVDVPIGTVVYLEKDHSFMGDLNEEGKTLLVCKGGRGGKGNAAYKTATNRVPKVAENGEPGETKRIILELKLLADVGLVGYPSVGKSTLLSVVSAARPEIGDYDFTTLEPNLGVVKVKDGRSFVMADLPGLIEGAHLGKGLGLRFLRHIERCRVIVHIIDMGSDKRDQYHDYVVINQELKEYGFGLENRPQIVVASKMDEEGAIERLEKFKSQAKDIEIIPISSVTDEGIDELLYRCADLLDQTPPFPLVGSTEEVLDTKVYELKESEPEFYIRKNKAHEYEIYGDKIVKFYRMTNISTDEGLMKLVGHLRKIGVDDMLEEMGIEDGDTVILDDFEFEYEL